VKSLRINMRLSSVAVGADSKHLNAAFNRQCIGAAVLCLTMSLGATLQRRRTLKRLI
jgi:hypothetical protein